MPGNIREFRKGQSLGENIDGHIVLSEEGARKLNELRDVFQAVLNIMGFGDARAEFDPSSGSLTVSHTRRDPLPVMLSGAGNPYSGEERQRDSGAWTEPASAETFTENIYEVNGLTGLAGKVVRIRPSPHKEGEWLFQYRRVGEGEPCNGSICIRVVGVACEGEGDPPPLDGVLVNVFTDPGEEFVGSCTTGLGDRPPGECCVNVPPGTYLIRIPSPGPEEECSIEVGDIVVVCDEVMVDDQVTCCGQINITVIDADTEGVIDEASIPYPGIEDTGDGTWKLVWTSEDHCDGETTQIIIGAEGYFSQCLEIEFNCHEQPNYTVKLYPESDYVLTGTECDCENPCDGGATRPGNIWPKLLYGTPTGPVALFGPWVGASIPLTYIGTAEYHVWQSDCLETGGQWRCTKAPAVNCCEEGGLAVPSGIRAVTIDDTEAPDEITLQDYPHARMTFGLIAPGETGACAVITWENLHAEDCTGESPTLCNSSLGAPTTWPLYCLFTSEDFGVECGPGHGTNDCAYHLFTYPSHISGNVGFEHSTFEAVCAPANADLLLYDASDCEGPEYSEPGSDGRVLITEM